MTTSKNFAKWQKSGALSILPLEDKEEAARVWKIRGMLVKGVEAVSEQEPLDIVVPINQIDAFVNFVNAFEKRMWYAHDQFRTRRRRQCAFVCCQR